MSEFALRPLTPSDRPWVTQRIAESWGAEIVVVHETVYHPAELPGFAAFAGEEPVGLLTYNIAGNECEIVTLDSWREGLGIGTALIAAARQATVRGKFRRLFLVTTNNNTHALHFYQKRGFVIAAIHINALEKARRLKPEIPLIGEDGIPLRDEIELEMIL
jgi:ribosomal protein S18 acetylase RimI-like enzyme